MRGFPTCGGSPEKCLGEPYLGNVPSKGSSRGYCDGSWAEAFIIRAYPPKRHHKNNPEHFLTSNESDGVITLDKI